MPKKTILFTSNYPYGGASANLLRYFTFCLHDAGHEVEVFLPTGASYGKKLDQQSVRKGAINGIKYRRLGFIHHPANFFGKLLDNLLGLLLPFIFLLNRSIKKKVDVVFVYDPTLLSLLVHLFSKLTLRKKLVVILPEFYEKPIGKHWSFAMMKWYNFYLGIKFLTRYADKFIVLSSYLKSYLEARLETEKEILIVPNLTDPERFSLDEVKPYIKNCITIGYIGTPVKKDGILDLIASFSIINKTFPKTHLLIIGDLTNGKTTIPLLKSYAQELGINEKAITFAGLTSFVDVPKLLLACQILALTRPNGVFAEAGFPTKLGEYFACKKPVVITRVGDIPRYFKDKRQVVLVEPENVESIVKGFEYLILNQNKAEEIGVEGYKWMNEHLFYKNQIKRISSFIEDL